MRKIFIAWLAVLLLATVIAGANITTPGAGIINIFGNLGAGNYAQFGTDGFLKLVGNAVAWDDIRVFPGAFEFPGVNDPSLASWQPGG